MAKSCKNDENIDYWQDEGMDSDNEELKWNNLKLKHIPDNNEP